MCVIALSVVSQLHYCCLRTDAANSSGVVVVVGPLAVDLEHDRPQQCSKASWLASKLATKMAGRSSGASA